MDKKDRKTFRSALGLAFWKTGEDADGVPHGYRPGGGNKKNEVSGLDSLAQYEETGLSPAEVKEAKSVYDAVTGGLAAKDNHCCPECGTALELYAGGDGKISIGCFGCGWCVSLQHIFELALAWQEGSVFKLPRKVYDSVYCIVNGKVRKAKVISYKVDINGPSVTYGYDFMGYCEGDGVFGKDVFPTEAEAEAALESTEAVK